MTHENCFFPTPTEMDINFGNICLHTGFFFWFSEMQDARTVVLHRAKRGFGFILRGAKAASPLKPSERCPGLQYLDDVDPGGVADLAGLQPGDFLMAVSTPNAPHCIRNHFAAGSRLNSHSPFRSMAKMCVQHRMSLWSIWSVTPAHWSPWPWYRKRSRIISSNSNACNSRALAHHRRLASLPHCRERCRWVANCPHQCRRVVIQRRRSASDGLVPNQWSPVWRAAASKKMRTICRPPPNPVRSSRYTNSHYRRHRHRHRAVRARQCNRARPASRHDPHLVASPPLNWKNFSSGNKAKWAWAATIAIQWWCAARDSNRQPMVRHRRLHKRGRSSTPA